MDSRYTLKVITPDGKVFNDFAFIVEISDAQLKEIKESPNKVNNDLS